MTDGICDVIEECTAHVSQKESELRQLDAKRKDVKRKLSNAEDDLREAEEDYDSNVSQVRYAENEVSKAKEERDKYPDFSDGQKIFFSIFSLGINIPILIYIEKQLERAEEILSERESQLDRARSRKDDCKAEKRKVRKQLEKLQQKERDAKESYREEKEILRLLRKEERKMKDLSVSIKDAGQRFAVLSSRIETAKEISSVVHPTEILNNLELISDQADSCKGVLGKLALQY